MRLTPPGAIGDGVTPADRIMISVLNAIGRPLTSEECCCVEVNTSDLTDPWVRVPHEELPALLRSLGADDGLFPAIGALPARLRHRAFRMIGRGLVPEHALSHAAEGWHQAARSGDLPEPALLRPGRGDPDRVRERYLAGGWEAFGPTAEIMSDDCPSC